MDVGDSCYDNDFSFDWKGSCFKGNDVIRKVHSTPIMGPDIKSNRFQGTEKSKKLFVSFRQDAEEDYEVRPALSCRSLLKFSPVPEPDCVVVLCRQKFYCNRALLNEYSALFRQIDVPDSTDLPLTLNSANQIYPNTFWLIYQWMNLRGRNENMEFINLHWVAELYLAAQYLIVEELKDACFRYLTDRDKIKEEKAFFVFQGLHKYEAKDLCDYLVSLIQGSFTSLAGTKDFLNLSCEQVLQLLYSDYIVVSGEIEVFYAGVRWILDHVEEREIYIEEIMSAVRFHFMELKQLLKIIREFPKITGKTPVSLMIERAVRVAVLKDAGIKDKEGYFTHLVKQRYSPYKPVQQQVESYREYIHLSRMRREKRSRIYHNSSTLRFPKTRFVEDMENLYTTWKINNASWESVNYKHIGRKLSNTFS